MTITEFRVGASHTLNTGNFSSFKVEAQVVVSVPEGDDYEALTEKAQQSLRRLLEQTYRAQRGKGGNGDPSGNTR